MVYLNAFGGGLNSTVTASSSVLIRNVFAGFIDTKNGVKNPNSMLVQTLSHKVTIAMEILKLKSTTLFF